MENVTAQVDNSTAQDGTATVIAGAQETTTTTTAPSTAPASPLSGWKSALRTDLKDSPLSQKFEDTPDGLNKMTESYANLEKLLGHEKVPIPKDVNDVEGWNRFSKAMGIPDKAEGYGLPDAKLPDSMKGITIDKNKFAELMHAHKVHPSAVKGLWENYQRLNIETYNKAMKDHQDKLNSTVNQLKGEWGDTYGVNVELGQAVINKFSEDQEMNDYLTSTLTQDPRGIKFLAKIGDQFAENKVGEFSMKKFSLGPADAEKELMEIRSNPKHPYNDDKAPTGERQAAIDYVNNLHAVILRAKGQA